MRGGIEVSKRVAIDVALPMVAIAVATDARGLARHSLSIPNQGGLAGSVLYRQYLALDPTGTTLGLITPNHGRILVGR